MRIIKSAHGFTISATSTVRVTFFDWCGVPSARMYWNDDARYPDIFQTEDPRQLWRAAFRNARRAARFDYDKQPPTWVWP